MINITSLVMVIILCNLQDILPVKLALILFLWASMFNAIMKMWLSNHTPPTPSFHPIKKVKYTNH